MNNSNPITASHLKRKAVIYIRQSTHQQVLSNQESQKLQRKMKDRAIALGWVEQATEVIETDLGFSGSTTEDREGYKQLLSQIVLGDVGMVLSYESARLTRNCADWHLLLNLCSRNSCLVADRDGVYDPSGPNDRLLLGIKGLLSENELHVMRIRLLAGIINKAKRGDLIQRLPAGLIRLEEGVVKDPDIQVQHHITLVFSTFLKVKSVAKVLLYFRDHTILLPRHSTNKGVTWRAATLGAIGAILRNPAYAGTFVYGRTRSERQAGSSHLRKRAVKKENWKAIVHDKYPAYISWETFEKIGSIMEDNYAEYVLRVTNGSPRKGSALLQGLVYCGKCGHKMLVQYKPRTLYNCKYLTQNTGAPVCQSMRAGPIEQKVIEAYFEALSPVELNLYEEALQLRSAQHKEVEKSHQLELERLKYKVNLTRRRYDGNLTGSE